MHSYRSAARARNTGWPKTAHGDERSAECAERCGFGGVGKCGLMGYVVFASRATTGMIFMLGSKGVKAIVL